MTLTMLNQTENVALETGAPQGAPVTIWCERPNARRNSVALFAAVVLAWLAFDQVTKAYFNGFEVGQVIAGPFLGLFEFQLIHNTGAAWGMFGDSTFALGVMSVCVCVLLTAYLLFCKPPASLLQTLGLALVVSGGIGNAIDRFAQAYVVDFINLAFMDFPVFNIADIGVTCGFVLFLAGYLLAERTLARAEEQRDAAEADAEGAEAEGAEAEGADAERQPEGSPAADAAGAEEGQV